MDFLDYAQLTTGQKISYKIKSFFTGIPGAIVGLFKAIGKFFKGVFSWIGNGLKGYGSRFAKGDIGTKLSYIIMGAGSAMHGQIGKGLCFLAAQIAYIMFMMNFGSVYISKIWGTVHFDEVSIEKVTYQNVDITGVVGNVPPNYDVDPIFGAKTITNLDSLDDSNKVLLFLGNLSGLCFKFSLIVLLCRNGSFTLLKTLMRFDNCLLSFLLANLIPVERHWPLISRICLSIRRFRLAKQLGKA